ncbi:MAG: HpcH/HpaI aldolase/citrate lyase family protein [Atribacterota bacterium]|jgi:citrate lyase beta subunit|nr:HpcH/HpaI aldolase/citrate lyase family protein [Atribacterota bacterium]
MRHAERLGASLYIPASHPKLSAIANGRDLPGLRSMIMCTEDSVSERDLSQSLENLRQTLASIDKFTPSLRFVRVRNERVLNEVLAMPGVENLDGFVLPKITRENIDRYVSAISHTEHDIMPTLETREVFCDEEMRLLRQKLSEPQIKSRILALRIGGNDLLSLLGVRRPRHVTIYRTPLGAVIARLVTTFRPHGFHLTAPVFEHIDLPQLLADEVAEDMLHGLVGKSSIHPEQVALIEGHYRVQPGDVEAAMKILDTESSAVFKMGGSMCEVATHTNWARNIMTRRNSFGQLDS